MDKTSRIKELVKLLNEASKAYYQQDTEIMSNFEYDALYDELVSLEEETGLVLSNSPTVNVGYEVISELPKEAHPSPMLSLDKTKDVSALADWLTDKDGVLSWKMDGLTVVLTYADGELKKAVTRGNGEIGEVITNNALVFANLPRKVSYKGQLIIRGEAIITYSEFERINATIPDAEAKYKNPRNLCSGTVRQLNNHVTAGRNVNFFAFNMLDIGDADVDATVNSKFDFLESLGFQVVEHVDCNAKDISDKVKFFADKIATNDFPSDGLVLSFDDIAYGRSLGRTAKFPRDSIAFKWADEEAETILREVEWSPSRTGLINPVAIFDTVSLEGTLVSRASIHNVSICKQLKLGIGDTIKVYKANMIIPQISENLTGSGTLVIPDTCPACGKNTELRADNDVETLYCPNLDCPAKSVKLFSHFVSRNAMNIDGMSEATLSKFIDMGYLVELYDIYRLEEYKDKIVELEGFGEKSYENIIKAVNQSRNTDLVRLLYGLGILNVGNATAKLIVKHFDYDIEAIIAAPAEEFAQIEGIGDVIAENIVNYFAQDNNIRVLRELLKEVTLVKEEKSLEQDLAGKTFVITGSLNSFANRDELKALIEDRGGKVAGSVSAKTSYLINNDVNSSSSKNKKAKSLGVPIISEEDFLKL
ncbi:MAG: NAD-dependent DNA ligase LigA [Lachnospiraceae bacterium]|nr:NAD-dependent DNA ligase LigA [Lachnospiraceae bacterium]MBQ8318234.1 NAD-dependent DNA ligase LigA [Lachnospiraceae bacterium]